MKRKRLFLLILFLPLLAKSQIGERKYSLATPSPNVAAIERYGEIPVSLYTGIPNIEIPIFEINVHGFKLPITLSYHAGGIKVQDIASWVGTGWSLNAGGQITRTQRGGCPDEAIFNNSSILNDISLFYNPSTSEDKKQEIIKNIFAQTQGKYNLDDILTDEYHLNTGNKSMKFFLDFNKKAHTQPASNTIINPDGILNVITDDIPLVLNLNDNFFAEWTVKDDDGITYYFGRDYSSNKCRENVEIQSNRIDKNPPSPPVVNTWFLNKIVLPNGETISFKYDFTSFEVSNNMTCLPVMFPGAKSSTSVYNRTCRLKEITFPTGKIKFVTGGRRLDLANDEFLSEIQIYNDLELVKKYKLQTNNPSNISGNTSNDDNFRLYLLGVQETSKDGVVNNQYKFEYYPGLPGRKSYAQDLWGYYNGKDLNTSLIPITYDKSIGDADMSINSYVSHCGTLEKIIYPTGGYTRFEYENNIARRIVQNLYDPFDCLLLFKKIPAKFCSFNFFKAGQESDISKVFEIKENVVTLGTGFNIMTYGKDRTSNIDDIISVHLLDEEGKNKCDLKNDKEEPYVGAGKYRLKYDLKNMDYYSPYSTPPITFDITLGVHWYEKSERVMPSEDYVGGLRIKSIKNYDQAGKILSTKSFSYDFSDLEEFSQFAGNAPNLGIHGIATSGVVQNTPVSFVKVETERGINFRNGDMIFANMPPFLNKGGLVEYKQVTVDYGNDGKTINFFTTADDYPNLHLENTELVHQDGYTNYEWRRGLPLGIIDLKKENGEFKKTRTQKFTYNFNSSPDAYKCINNYYVTGDKKSSTYPPLRFYRGKDVISEFFYQSSKVEEIYTNGQTIRNEILSDFDPIALQLRSETITNSTKDIKTTVYKYPSNFFNPSNVFANDSSSKALRFMLDKNMMKMPVEQVEIVKKANGEEYITGGNIFLYHIDKPLVKKKLRLINNVLIPLNKFKFSAVENGNFTYFSNYLATEHFDSYDSKYNLLQSHKEGDIPFVNIWSYNYQYPIVKIANATYTDVESALGGAQIVNEFASRTNPTSAEIDAFISPLKSNNKIKNAQVVTFSYKPLAGMISAADMRGQTSRYVYDNFNRLTSIAVNGSIVSSFNYNYYNTADNEKFFSNTALSRTFTKVCPSGDTGSSITYTVPAGRYTSKVSQADADAKAQADIENNGQNYANTTGSCFYLTAANIPSPFLAAGGSQTLPISTNTSWSASSSNSWITVTPTSASGNATLGITCSANAGAPRTGTVTLQSAPSYGSITKVITVNQDGTSYLTASDQYLELDWAPGSIKVSVSSIPTWSITSKEGTFIMASKVDEQTLKISYSKNLGIQSRSGSVTISNGTQRLRIEIIQGTAGLNPEIM